MRRLAKAHEPRHVAHRDRGLLDQQLRGHVQAARNQILAEGDLAELGIGARELTRRAGQRPGDPLERQRTPVVASDDHASKQVQPATLLDRGGTHTFLSDPSAANGTSRFSWRTRRLSASGKTRGNARDQAQT
jgi:hypothetical protein